LPGTVIGLPVVRKNNWNSTYAKRKNAIVSIGVVPVTGLMVVLVVAVYAG
jgi:hypothetical protein